MKHFEGRLSGDPDRFIFTAYRGLWAQVRELAGSCDLGRVLRQASLDFSRFTVSIVSVVWLSDCNTLLDVLALVFVGK
jgi:hypothetical protein